MFADRYDAFLLDLDGVLFRGDEPIPGAAEAVGRLRGRRKGLAFVTNNSARTPDQVASHLGHLGIEASPHEIETSALTTASLLTERGITSAYVNGEEGLRVALSDAGIAVVELAAEAVVVGWDRTADYEKLRLACIQVQRGATLIGSNPDTSYPAPDGTRWPGAGALLAAVEATCGVRAEVVGKPNAPIFEAALRRAGGGRPLVVGDRLDTDIEGARRLGWDALLVLTGISTSEEAADAVWGPTAIAADVSALFDQD